MISPEVLRRFPLFAGLEAEALKQIAMLSDEVSYQRGERLFHQDESAEALYMVLDGSVGLMVNLDEAGEHHAELSTHTVGEVIGWSALTPPYKYTLGALAKSDATLARLDGPKLRSMLEADPATGYRFMQNMLQAIGGRLLSLRIQFISMISS
jgi:CRP/FNR family cyclic AMP-dependent transcriptional regulator